MSKEIQLLKEPEYPILLDPIYEAETNLKGEKTKVLKLYGTAVVCDKEGINGRSYPLKIMKAQADRYMKKFVRNGRSFAELNHPRLNEKGEGKDYSVFEINLAKVCALIEELKFDGNRMLIKFRIVEDHPCGQMIKAIVNAGGRPGCSLRGAGSVIQNAKGVWEVTDDYRLITVDLVGNPSFDDDAIMDSLYESIKGKKINILTESINIACDEFMNVMDKRPSIVAGRKEYNREALINLFESFSTNK